MPVLSVVGPGDRADALDRLRTIHQATAQRRPGAGSLELVRPRPAGRVARGSASGCRVPSRIDAASTSDRPDARFGGPGERAASLPRMRRAVPCPCGASAWSAAKPSEPTISRLSSCSAACRLAPAIASAGRRAFANSSWLVAGNPAGRVTIGWQAAWSRRMTICAPGRDATSTAGKFPDCHRACERHGSA